MSKFYSKEVADELDKEAKRLNENVRFKKFRKRKYYKKCNFREDEGIEYDAKVLRFGETLSPISLTRPAKICAHTKKECIEKECIFMRILEKLDYVLWWK